MNVLVAEDDEPLRKICARTLSEGGHRVTAVASGDEAAARLNEAWDLVLTDVRMPGSVGGLELLRKTREATAADVILMTGAPELKIAIEALRHGAYDFIVKPFTPDVLEAAVRRCADKRDLSTELARERALREELTRMQRVKDVFGLFVTSEVVDHVLSLPPEDWRRGEKRTVTVLFADIRRFTPFAEASEPETAVATVNEFLSCVIHGIRQEGGTINKFIGDGLLALFGAPLDMAAHERAAARAALAAMSAVRSLNETRQASGRPPLQIGIGINTGEVVAGCLGTAERTEYSVIGHAVNLASRLEDAAGPGQILVGPRTASALGDGFRLLDASDMTLPGVASPVRISTLGQQEE